MRHERKVVFSGQQFLLSVIFKLSRADTTEEEYPSRFEQREAVQAEREQASIQRARENGMKEREESECEVIIDDEEQSEGTTKTVGTAFLHFVQGSLGAAERCKKEEKEYHKMGS